MVEHGIKITLRQHPNHIRLKSTLYSIQDIDGQTINQNEFVPKVFIQIPILHRKRFLYISLLI